MKTTDPALKNEKVFSFQSITCGRNRTYPIGFGDQFASLGTCARFQSLPAKSRSQHLAIGAPPPMFCGGGATH